MSSLHDQLQDEINAVDKRKKNLCEEEKRAHKKVKSLEAELESTRKKMTTIQTKSEEAQYESDFLKHRLAFISNPKPIKVVKPYPHCPTMGYLSVLGRDLEGQNEVASMKLELRMAPGESIKTVQPLIQHIEGNKKLRKIELYYEKKTKPSTTLIRLSDTFLKAVASNSHVEDITIKVHPSVKAFCDFTPTCASYTFQVDDFRSAYPNYEDRNRIILHLLTMVQSTIKFSVIMESTNCRANPKKLHFHWENGSENACVFRYKSLSDTYPTLIASLETMPLLRSLELRGVQCSFRTWDGLFPSLCLLESLAELSLIDCYLDEAAANGFQILLQTRPLLRSLTVEWQEHGLDPDTSMGRRPAGELYASILNTLPSESNLQVLSLTVFKSLGVFLKTLVSRGPAIPIRKLCLKRIYGRDCAVLSRSLPQLTSLQELSMEILTSSRESEVIFPALQKNESLYQVTFLGEKGWNRIDEGKVQQVDAWCKRNQVLQSLLINVPSIEGHGTCTKTMIPMLVRAAQQIPSTAFTKILMSLKFNGDLIGPCCQVV